MALLLGALLLSAACQSSHDRFPPDLAALNNTTHLAAGDLIRLTFPGAPEFNQTQKVRSDGKISLPLLGEVQAEGASINSFQARLARLYKPQLENSEVVVALENRAIPVYVCGAVNRPGKVIIDRPVSALEAIMEAGGFSQTTADLGKVHLIRIENGHHQTTFLNLKSAINSQQTAAAYVKPYDVIYVPESLF